MRAARFFLPLLVSLAACGGASSNLGLGESGDAGDPAQSDGAAITATAEGGSSALLDAGSGPRVEVHLRGAQTPVSFTDGLSGETPLDQRVGVRSLTLLRSAGDPSPFVVFDNGASVVDAPVNAGSDTLVGSVVASSLPAATFTLARVGVGYYDFKVAGTLHANGQATPGDYHDVEVLSDGTSYHGQTFSHGYYSFTFEIGATAYGTVTGQTLVTPVDMAGGGLTLVASGNEVAYVFPVNVTLSPSLASAAKIALTANTYENFRWQDQSTAGYAAGVFDTTPTAYETVESFGANSFTLGLE